MLKVAVLLSGCGFMDGTEINEAVLTLLSLSLANVEYQCVAPNINQHHVTNHLTGTTENETRNVLVEAARIARGDILDLATANASDYDALIFPGGFGAATSLSDFADKGSDMSVQADVLKFAKAFVEAEKPIGFICIAPVLATQLIDNAKITIGNDADVAQNIITMGHEHVEADVTEIIIDKKNRFVSTPAFMLSSNLAEVFTGINACVERVVGLARKAKRKAA